MQAASDRGRELSFQLDNDALDPKTAFECLQSSNLSDQSLAFEVFTGASRRTVHERPASRRGRSDEASGVSVELHFC